MNVCSKNVQSVREVRVECKLDLRFGSVPNYLHHNREIAQYFVNLMKTYLELSSVL